MSESLIADADRGLLETKSIFVCKFVTDVVSLETRFYASAISLIGDAVLRVCNNNTADASLVMLIGDAFFSTSVSFVGLSQTHFFIRVSFK